MNISHVSQVADPGRIMQLRADILARSVALQPEKPAEPVQSFGHILSKVSEMQDSAGAVSEAFDRGDMTDIAQVMIARQKASVAFEATLQVRNKLLAAYRDIMNMSV